jgi:hypothetical protein
MLARYLSSSIPNIDSIFISTRNNQFPSVFWDIQDAGVRFIKASKEKSDFITNCIKNGLNKDIVFKKKISIEDCNEETLTGIIQMYKDEKNGSKVFIERKKVIYEAIDPVWSGSDYKEPEFQVGDIVDGNFYKGGKILRYLANGYYSLGFSDGSTADVSIMSMKKESDGSVSIPPKSATKKDSNKTDYQEEDQEEDQEDQEYEEIPFTASKKASAEDLAIEISDWLQSVRLVRLYGGEVCKEESNSGKRYYSVGFSYPRSLDGTVDVYGATFIRVQYTLRGINGNFIAKSKEELINLMTEKFGLFMDD